MNLLAWRYRRFHISHVLGWGCTGVLAGLALAAVWYAPVGVAIWLSVAVIMCGALRQRRWWSVVLVVCCGVVVGLGRGAEMRLALQPYERLIGQTVRLEGVIRDDPQYGSRGDQKFRVTQVVVDGVPLPGEVYVGTYSFLDVKRGDTVKLQGKIREGFGSYQASLSFARLEKATVVRDAVRAFRDRFAAGVRNLVAEPAASLGIGFVVGQRSALPEELDDQLRIVGLTHIVVASGYNLTILVRFARRLLEQHSKYAAAVVSSGLMVGFVAVSGLSPSMTRASLVTGLSLLAWYYGRRFHPLLLIIYVATLTAVLNPIFIWSDIGWYLSFLAFAGVLIVAPLLTRWWFRGRQVSSVLQVLVETTAAQLMTLPLILAIFGELPMLALIANVFVSPVIPLAMLCTVVAGCVGMLAPVWLGFVGVAAEIVMTYILAVVQWLALPSWSQLAVSVSMSVMLVLYGMVVAGVLILWHWLRYDFRSTSGIE